MWLETVSSPSSARRGLDLSIRLFLLNIYRSNGLLAVFGENNGCRIGFDRFFD